MARELQPSARIGTLSTENANGRFLIERGADLVHLAEDLGLRLFKLTLALVCIASVVMIPLGYSDSREHVGVLSYLFVAGALLAAAAALRNPRPLYRWLRYNRARALAPAALGAVLVLADAPYSPSWWIAMGLMFVVAAVSSASVTVAGSVLVAAAFVGGTLMRGSPLVPASDTGYLAEAVALVINPLVARAVAETFTRFILRLHQLERDLADAPQKPLRVDAVRDEPLRSVTASHAKRRGRHRRSPTTRLTARQLEAALLLRDGLRHGEIALCLDISPRQVERLVEQARGRVGAATTSELVAMLVDGRVAPPTAVV